MDKMQKRERAAEVLTVWIKEIAIYLDIEIQLMLVDSLTYAGHLQVSITYAKKGGLPVEAVWGKNYEFPWKIICLDPLQVPDIISAAENKARENIKKNIHSLFKRGLTSPTNLNQPKKEGDCMYRIRKEFSFEAAHRLLSSYTEQCKENIHGHSYRVEVFFSSAKLNEDGMVMDFKMLSDKFSSFIDLFDHALLLNVNDKRPDAEAIRACPEGNRRFMDFPGNPTAELMAKFFYDNLVSLVPEYVKFEKVRVWETAKCFAEYEGHKQ